MAASAISTTAITTYTVLEPGAGGLGCTCIRIVFGGSAKSRSMPGKKWRRNLETQCHAGFTSP